MTTAASPVEAEANGSNRDTIGDVDPTPAVSAWQAPTVAPHPQAADIVRQIDHYFSDDNLRQDAHLLALFQEGKGTVSLNEVLGFPKMRRFKPRSAVKEAVKQSTVVEIVENNKRIKLRQPLGKSITVVPKISDDRRKYVVPEDKPWLTKGMMKATGFEEYATCGPIDPSEYEEDRKEYDPDNAFIDRIETAIRKFTARRKMHEGTRLIFDKYMMYGGMDCGPGQFTGGLDSRAKEEYTKKEIAELTSNYNVSDRVVDGFLDGSEENIKPTYIVDFEATAKGFLSSEFPVICNWYDLNQIKIATNVLRNFYNYLLLHDVCPEYTTQLHAARKVCEVAEEEWPKLATVDPNLPGGFSKACSALFDGAYANLHAAGGDWAVDGDDIGWTKEDARLVFLSGIFAYGTEEQIKKIEAITTGGEALHDAIKVIFEGEGVGLEVVGIEDVSEAAKKIYCDNRLNDTVIKPMGKLRCKRWEVPHARPQDLPEWVLKKRMHEEFEFLLEDETLKNCFLGMKMEACVKELDIGIKFIDSFEATYVSFFTFLWNERIRGWKGFGSPLPWMVKANNIAKFGEMVESMDDAGGEALGDDELPD